jgi:hypothetical protein
MSTGGAPQCSVKKVELIKNDFHIKVIEHSFLAWSFVVQRNRIINLVGQNNFHSLGHNKFDEMKSIIDDFKPDVISMEEFPEMFMDDEMSSFLYSETRNWKIVESTHDSSFNPKNKKWMPDKFVFVSPYNMMKYDHLDIPQEIIDATPTDGLWDDDRNDESQIGATYEELEWVMEYGIDKLSYTEKEFKVLQTYQNFNEKNKHKMVSIPIFDLKKNEII